MSAFGTEKRLAPPSTWAHHCCLRCPARRWRGGGITAALPHMQAEHDLDIDTLTWTKHHDASDADLLLTSLPEEGGHRYFHERKEQR